MSRPSFFGELQRRHVYQVGAAYCVGGWLLVQVVTQVFPVFEISALVQRIIVLLVIAGFPVALALAWIFDITPDGLVRTATLPERGESPDAAHERRSMDRKLNYLLGTLLVIALGFAALEHTLLREASRKNADAAAVPGKSIAVLPFQNLSDDKANAYFSEGIQEEILTQLAKIGALKVISHTSTQQYASNPANLVEIAAQLGVANILEGSVQRAANSVHINVKLIRAATAESLWAESYNRKLDDIFGVQGEVARTVADRLNARLTGAEAQQLATKPTNDPAAYDAYLRGLVFTNRDNSAAANIGSAIAAFEEAVQHDPGFGLAWAWLAQEHSFAYWSFDKSASHRTAARKALEMAVRLAPDAAETLTAQGLDRYWLERDYAAAKAIFTRVRERYPNFADALWTLAAIDRRQGNWQESRQLYDETIALDPQNLRRLFDASQTLMAMRDLPGLQKLLDRGLAIAHDDPGMLATQVVAFQQAGAFDKAQAELDRVQVDKRDTFMVEAVVRNALLTRKYDAAFTLLESLLAAPEEVGSDFGEYAVMLGDLQRLTGDTAGALVSYDRARAALEKELQATPDNEFFIDRLAAAQAGLGNRSLALELQRRAVALLPAAKDAYVGPIYEEGLARLQARFGDVDAAITALQKLTTIAYGYPPVTPSLLRLDPDWDSLHHDERFRELLSRPDAAAAKVP
jgi:TolB-like protein/Tfp pilus assembly protein PilF